jgi:hypothetical protein
MKTNCPKQVLHLNILLENPSDALHRKPQALIATKFLKLKPHWDNIPAELQGMLAKQWTAFPAPAVTQVKFYFVMCRCYCSVVYLTSLNACSVRWCKIACVPPAWLTKGFLGSCWMTSLYIRMPAFGHSNLIHCHKRNYYSGHVCCLELSQKCLRNWNLFLLPDVRIHGPEIETSSF